MQDEPRAIVFDDLSTNAIGVVRGLGRRGVVVDLLSCYPRSLAQRSKHVSRVLRVAGGERDDEATIETLLASADSYSVPPVLVPTSDEFVLLLADRRARLEGRFVFNVGSAVTVRTLVDKSRFHSALTSLGTPAPRTLVSPSLCELDAFAGEIGYRGIAKPFFSRDFRRSFGSKTLVFEDEEEYGRTRARLDGFGAGYLVQEWVPGNDLYAFYTVIDRSGRPMALAGYDKLRSYPLLGGSGSLCVSRRRQDAIDLGLGVLLELGHRGLAEVEIKVDPRDDTPKIIEVNARSTTQTRLAEECAAQHIETCYWRDCRSWDAAANPLLDFEEGVKWISEELEVRAFRDLRAAGKTSLGEHLRSLRGRRVWATLDATDPGPTVAFAAGLLLRPIKRRLRRG